MIPKGFNIILRNLRTSNRPKRMDLTSEVQSPINPICYLSSKCLIIILVAYIVYQKLLVIPILKYPKRIKFW